MTFVYDIRTRESAIKSLCGILDIDRKKVEESCQNQVDIIENWEISFGVDKHFIERISLEGSMAIIQHLTTNNDNCNSIKKFGIINTQECLKKETSLKSFLEVQAGLYFDIDNRILYFNGIKYDIDYYKLKKNIYVNGKPPAYSLSRKIYAHTHYPINGFFSKQNLEPYSCVYEQPEIFRNISEFFESINLINYSEIELFDKWKKVSRPYLITFKTDFSEINKTDLIDQTYDEILVKKELVENALKVILLYKSEITVSLKSDSKVEYENIINIEKI